MPAGRFTMGALERPLLLRQRAPAHDVDLPGFRIGRTAITNATFLHFVEGGGYQRREWWSDEGWAWKEEYDITHPQGWAAGPEGWRQWRVDGEAPLHPGEPVVHISWFEADAFARAHTARLPTEAEWERAATWNQKRRFTSKPNLGQHGLGPHPVGTGPADAPLGMFGDTWEWTATEFDGYPGFVAHPYREYSEVFFRRGYRVLRGGSWATQARVATPDVPQLGPPPATPDLLRREARMGRMTSLRAARRTLADDALDGLTRPAKELPPKHFYDARGSELFDRICELPEYYPTRAERAILEARADAIVATTGVRELVELGSGTAAKTRVLLDAMARAGSLWRYVPVRRRRRHGAGHRGRAERRLSGPRRRRASPATSSTTSTRSRRPRTAARASSPSSAGRSATSSPARDGASCASWRRGSTTTASCCSAPTWSRTRPCSRPPTTTARA